MCLNEIENGHVRVNEHTILAVQSSEHRLAGALEFAYTFDARPAIFTRIAWACSLCKESPNMDGM